MSQERQEKCRAMVVADAPPSPSRPALLQQHHAAVYFGLSCALAALHHATGRVVAGGALGARRCRWSRERELTLQGKVAELELEVQELRRRRAEDARANEKVAGIYAAREQQWYAERKALRRQVHAVVAAARARELRHDEVAAELRRQLEDQQRAAALKDEAMEQEIRRREEIQEKLRVSEQEGEELRERTMKDAQEHTADLRKHKAAFVELASAQRQLEAELARATRHADSAEAELKAALERCDETAAMAVELSAEATRLRRDAEHKDKILSAMLRKSKIDMEDRETLVREVKMCKARRKQAELEATQWRKMWESRPHRRGSSRSSARCTAVDHPGCSDKLAPDAAGCTHDTKILFVDHVEAHGKKDRQAAVAPAAKELTTFECVDRYPSHVDDKPVVEEYQELQEWFHMETAKYTTMIRHRHSAEIEAFTEQLRLKDEKLEAFRWRAVSMDVEAARLRCRVQELETRLSRYEQHSAALEALLLDRESENMSLKEQLAMTLQPQVPDDEDEVCHNTCEHCIPCSPVKIQRTESREAEGLSCAAWYPDRTEIANARRRDHAVIKLAEPVPPDDHKNKAEFGIGAVTEGYHVSVSALNHMSAAAAPRSIDQDRHDAPADHPYRSEIEEEKEFQTDPGDARARTGGDAGSDVVTSDTVALAAAPEQKPSAWRVDIHALAVSYKIKRLKQQLLVLEKLAAAGDKEATKPSSNEASGGGRQQQARSYQLMMSFVSKHVKRYQSLEDKIDDLCTRMEESKRSGKRERQNAGDTEQSAAALGQFLEETFQLQRYMVATGQKLLEMQSRIAPSLARAAAAGNGGGDDGVDTGRFMDVVGALLRDVQRGLEVRIARIIGDLEGTLTFHGILRNTF